MTREVHRDSADEDFRLRRQADTLEAQLLDAAIAMLGDEMAEAIDQGRMIQAGSSPSSIMEKSVEIDGKMRRVKLTFEMSNAKK